MKTTSDIFGNTLHPHHSPSSFAHALLPQQLMTIKSMDAKNSPHTTLL